MLAAVTIGVVLLGIYVIWIKLLKPSLNRLDDAIIQLARSERQLKTTLNSIGDAVIATGSDLNILSMNPVAEALTGWQFQQAQGMPLRDVVKLDYQHPLIDAAKPIEAARLISPESSPTGNHILTSNSGAKFRVTASVAPLRSDDHDTQGIVVVLRDVTQQLELQKKLDRKAKLQAIGELASGVAHDFNNILGVIMGTSSTVQRLDVSQHVKDRIDRILNAARTGALLTEKLLSFARSSPATPRLESIHGILQSVEQKAKTLVASNIKIEIVCSTDLYAEVQPAGLETALLHLVMSAREALSEGGNIRLLAYDEIRNDISVLTVCVEDDGEIPPAQQSDALIDDFFASKRTSRAKGLGVPMATAFAEQAGGELRIVANATDRRTFIFLHFPIAARLRIAT